MKLLANSFIDSSLFILLVLVAVFGLIVLGVILIKKYSKHFQSNEKPKSDKEIAEEEVNRLLVDVDNEKTKEEMEEAAKEIEKKSKKVEEKPSEKEILEDEMNRLVSPVTNEESLKAMEEYSKEHPDEEKEATKKEEK